MSTPDFSWCPFCELVIREYLRAAENGDRKLACRRLVDYDRHRDVRHPHGNLSGKRKKAA